MIIKLIYKGISKLISPMIVMPAEEYELKESETQTHTLTIPHTEIFTDTLLD